jgi:bifunctional non-homologous end joining protein LigD
VNRSIVETKDRRLSVSNLDKDLYPSYGFTKAEVFGYYRGIAPLLLPHLRDRALTLKRYPDGVEKGYFFEKRCPAHRPAWVQTAEVEYGGTERMTVCLVNDLETLLWAENLASLELHVPLARVGSPDTPDSMVFDLDPGEPAGVLECARVALVLRDLLGRMGLAGYAKTSGRKGLHVFVPLNRQETSFEDTKTFSRTVAGALQKHYPELVTARMAKQERRGKVFINWSQNDAKKTMVSVYSLRAGTEPTVSFPLEWTKVEEARERGSPGMLKVLHDEAVSRAEERGDLFREMLVKEQKLPHL